VTLLFIAQGKGWFLSYHTYRINLKQGYNLHQGSLVKMFNTEIGKVTRVRIIREKGEPAVEVTVKILTDYADLICRNSFAEVVTPTLFGSEYIDISPGSPTHPPIPQFDPIPYFQSKKPLTESVSQLLNDDNIQRVQAILTNITQLTDQLKHHEKAWLTTINHVDKVMVSLLQSEGTLGELLMRRDFARRLDQTLTHMDRVLKEANTVTVGLKPVAANLESATLKLNQELETLKSILADIKGGSPGVPKAVETVTEFGQGGTEVVDAVKANPLIRMTLPKSEKGQALHVEPRHVQ